MFHSPDSISFEIKSDSFGHNDGGWEHEIVSGTWRKSELPVQAKPFEKDAAESFSGSERHERENVKEKEEGRRLMMTNGDIVSLGSDGFKWTDKNGNQVKAVNIIVDNGIPGHTSYEMSNGARYNSGCWSESISYPNGDSINFYRNGHMISANIDGIKFK